MAVSLMTNEETNCAHNHVGYLNTTFELINTIVHKNHITNEQLPDP